jgi:DNA repair protein RadD
MNQQQLVGDIVTHWLKHAEGRRSVCFTTGIKHSVNVRDEFRKAGVLAEHIDGKTPQAERDEILRRLSAGEIQVVANCMVLTEGWDQPPVSCLILARPTRQLGLFRQMVGRVLRTHPGKDHALILDHSGATFDHGFAEDAIAWTLDSDEVAVNEAHAARKEQHHRGLTTCPECSAVRMEGDPCHSCGWKPTPKPRHIDCADGDLARIERDRSQKAESWTPDEQASFYRQLMWLAQQRQRKPGWAAHRYKDKFGQFPPWNWNNAQPLPASGAVISWSRSRDIAFAKSMPARPRIATVTLPDEIR